MRGRIQGGTQFAQTRGNELGFFQARQHVGQKGQIPAATFDGGENALDAAEIPTRESQLHYEQKSKRNGTRLQRISGQTK